MNGQDEENILEEDLDLLPMKLAADVQNLPPAAVVIWGLLGWGPPGPPEKPKQEDTGATQPAGGAATPRDTGEVGEEAAGVTTEEGTATGLAASASTSTTATTGLAGGNGDKDGNRVPKPERYWRMYLPPYLDQYIEFRDADVLHRQKAANYGQLVTTLVWLREGAEVKHVRIQRLESQRSFLQGGIANTEGAQPQVPQWGGQFGGPVSLMGCPVATIVTACGLTVHCTGGGGSFYPRC